MAVDGQVMQQMVPSDSARATRAARTPRTSRPRVAPHVQVLILAAVVIAVVVVLVLVPRTRADDAHHSLGAAVARYEPRVTALDRVAAQLAAETATSAALAAAPAQDRQAAVLATSNQYLATEAAWEKYLRLRPLLPNETVLRSEFESARQAARDAGTSVLAETGSFEAPVLAASLAAQQRPIGELRDEYQRQFMASVMAADRDVDSVLDSTSVLSVLAATIVGAAFLVVILLARRRELTARAIAHARAQELARSDLDARVQRGLAMLDDEEACYPIVARATSSAAPTFATELLVADSSRAHFRQAFESREHTPACSVASPSQCPVASGGHTEVWSDPEAIDACPQLRGIDCGGHASVCVPVSIAGKTIGVLHSTELDARPVSRNRRGESDDVDADDRRAVDRDQIAALELVARQTGERVGVIRAFAQSQTQAQTDPLTGLVNRRSLEKQVLDLTEAGTPYVVVFADLDQFKMLNDVHGHEVGDRALRLFARVLRDSVRPADVPARFGGEEFVIVVPDCEVEDATAVIERVRDRLRRTTEDGSVPAFTASYGVASSAGIPFTEALARADAALLQAKARGRDRIVIAGSGEGPTSAVAEPVHS